MDPVARREFLDLVHEQALNEGAAIFFSTHLIDDIEAAANRIGIIESGRTIYEGGLEPLAQSVRTCSAPLNETTARQPALQPVPPGNEQQFQLLRDYQRGGRRIVVVRFDGPAPLQLPLNTDWRQDNMTLEDVFIAMVAVDPS